MDSVYYSKEEFGESTREETVKTILENHDAILKELDNVTYDIYEAIRGKRQEVRGDMTPCDDSMLATLRRQRDLSERILKTVVSIKESLW